MLCHRTLRNSRSAGRHFQRMHETRLTNDDQTALDTFFHVETVPGMTEDFDGDEEIPGEGSVLDDFSRMRARMICRVGIPICALQSRYFKEFSELMGLPKR